MHLPTVLLIALVAAAAAQPLTTDTIIDPTRDGPEASRLLGGGWWDPEADGRWTGRDGQAAEIVIPAAPGHSYEILLFSSGPPPEAYSEAYRLRVLIGGRPDREIGPTVPGVIRVSAGADQAGADGVLHVAFEVPLFCPHDQGNSPDGRTLGLKVRKVRITPYREAPTPAEGTPRVALFRDPGAPAGEGCADPVRLAELVRLAGMEPEFVDAAGLADSGRFGRARFDIIVLPYGPAFPESARSNFLRFLRAGGSFLSTGGYAFDVLYGGEMNAELLDDGDFEPGQDGWVSHLPEHPQATFEVCAAAARTGQAGARLRLGAAVPPDWHSVTRDVSGLTPGTAVELSGAIRAEGVRDGHGAYAAISFHGADGKRLAWADTNIVSGTRDWGALAATATVPEGTVLTRVSLLMHGHGLADFDEVSLRHRAAPMNTAQGRGADFLELDPEQLGCFDAGYPLSRALQALATPEFPPLAPDLAIAGPFSGWAAVGMTGEAWYCTTEDKCRWTPILRGLDRFGRPAGPVGALMRHYRGPYRGSFQAFFGVTNTDLFSGRQPAADAVFAATLRCLRHKVFVHETRPEWACLRVGEAAVLRTRVSNWGRESVRLTVALQLVPAEGGEPEFGEERECLLPPGETQDVEVRRPPGPFAHDLYRVRAELRGDGHLSDVEDSNGVAVWKDDVARRPGRIHLENNYLQTEQGSQFLLGGQQFWSSKSLRNSSPLVVNTDFAAMRDFGVRLNRSFMMWALRPAEEEQRFRDMMVYLSQRHGILMFYEGIADCPPRTDDFAAEIARARDVATRYGDLPRFCIDLRNEPSLRISDDGRQLQWLRDTVRGIYDGPAPYGDPRIAPLTSVWGDARSADLHTCLAERLALWSKTLSETLHTVRPDLLVSVGFLQPITGAGVMQDPVRASAGLDFMNRHFYGPLRSFPAQFAETDLRALGQAPSTGEFGSKTHPGKGGNFESRDEQVTRYLFITRTAYGLGGIFASNWHWRDPWENIFPYGLFHQDGRPKDIAKVYRASALVLGSLRPRYESPQAYVLLPDTHRLAYYPLTTAIHHALDELMNLRLDAAVLPEGAIARIPDAARLVVYPLPLMAGEDVVVGLEAFVRRGGVLCLTGDLAYERRTFAREHAERLERLAGIRRSTALSRGLADLPETQDIHAQVPGLHDFSGRTMVGFEALPGTDVLASNAAGAPVAVAAPLERGAVIYCATALEQDAAELARSGLYRFAAQKAGLAGNAVQPERPDLHVSRVPTVGGTSFVVCLQDEAGGKAVAVTLPTPGRVELAAQPMRPCVVHVTAGGAVTILESAGDAVWPSGSIRSDTAFSAIALDGLDLAHSRSLALIALAPGRILLPLVYAGRRAEVGEVRDGAWQTLQTGTVAAADGAVAVTDDTALEIILVAEDIAPARKQLLRALGF